jgi:hypothetical protein
MNRKICSMPIRASIDCCLISDHTHLMTDHKVRIEFINKLPSFWFGSFFSSGNMNIIAAIEDPRVIRKILEHMGLDTKPPPLKLARGPPKVQYHFEDDLNQQYLEMNFDNFHQSAD